MDEGTEPVVPEGNRFPRSERLTRKQDYDAVFRQGVKHSGGVFACHVLRQAGQGCKLGIAVPRKCGSAVVRNRIKRRVREVYRNNRAAFTQEARLVIVARPGAGMLSFVESEAALLRLFRQGGLLPWPG